MWRPVSTIDFDKLHANIYPEKESTLPPILYRLDDVHSRKIYISSSSIV